MLPLISVIVPVYNVEDCIHVCVESVLKQSYEQIELLLVDDGSTDSSGKICDEYANNDKRVRVIHKENGGVASARNRGLDEAKGEYITFLDSDDYLDLDMLEYLYGLIRENGADYAKCPARLIDWPLCENIEYPETDFKVYSKKEAVRNTLIGRNGFTGSSCHNLYKREILTDMYFIGIRSNEDLDFITRVAINAGNVVVTRCAKYNYTYQPGGGHATPLKQFMEELDLVYERLEKIINSEMPDIHVYLDVRYFRNAIDMLNNELQHSEAPFDPILKEAANKIKSKKIPLEYLNKTEKVQYYTLRLGLGPMKRAGALINKYKERKMRK